MPIYVFACEKCKIELPEEKYPMGHREACPECAEPMGYVPQLFTADAWGAPRHDRALDMDFSSKDEWRKELKRRGLEPAGDRVGGARSMITSPPSPRVDKKTRDRYTSFGPEAI